MRVLTGIYNMTKKFDINVDTERDEYVITLRFNCNSRRVNPYMPDDYDNGSYSEIVGVINQETDEFGFAYTIDMDYTGKQDQYTKTFLDVSMTNLSKDSSDFIRLCEEWSIPYVIE